MSLINPINYLFEHNYNNHTIKYTNFREISQGGPQVGNLSIDGAEIGKDIFFGGPLFYFKNYIIVPILVTKFFKRGFQISVISLTTKGLITLGKVKDIILIYDVNESGIYYYTDIQNTKKESISISNIFER